MHDATITPVTPATLPLLDAALRALAADLGDAYTAAQADLATAVCGARPDCLAVLALRGGAPVGAVLAAPVFSTLRGGMGLFVSDLWVAEPARGQGLARSLLAAVLHQGAARGAAGFLKLTVYHDNPGARAVYARLGLDPHPDETNMTLTGTALTPLKETP